MAITLSTSLVNILGQGCSLADVFNGGEIQIRTGSGASVNSAATGTLLVTCTNASGARTADTMATCYLAFSGGGAADTVDNITIDGYEVLGSTVTYSTGNDQVGDDVAEQINLFTATPIKVWAYSDGSGNVTISCTPGQGDTLNTVAVAVSITQVGGALVCAINGASADQMGVGAGGSTAGVDSANGLTFSEISAGILTATCTMSGTPGNTGTAGHFRLEGCTTPTGVSAADTVGTAPRYRIQGTCGLASADMIFSGTTTITSGVTHTVTSGTITVPTS